MKITALELQAIRAKQRHGELIVDVESVPVASATATVIELESLDELFKAAEALLKPVLHRVEPDRHIYFVVDGDTMYGYVSVETDR